MSATKLLPILIPSLFVLSPACGDDDSHGGSNGGSKSNAGGSTANGGGSARGGGAGRGGSTGSSGGTNQAGETSSGAAGTSGREGSIGGESTSSGGSSMGGDGTSGGEVGRGGRESEGGSANGGDSEIGNGGISATGGSSTDGTGGVIGLPSATATAISVGRRHSCAITSAGAVRCWGSADHGALGNGVIDSSSAGRFSTPVQVQGLTSGATSIASFGDTTCAVVSGGVKCWGANEQGQLGDGTRTESGVPVAVAALTSGVTAVAVGDQHSCALTTDGAVKCWGKNDFGQLGNDSVDDYSTSVVDVSGLNAGVTAISAGLSHVCAVVNGGAKCWGSNLYGELGIGASGNGSSVPVDVSGLTSDVIAVTAGDNVSCAIKSDNALECWGKNADGQVGNNVAGSQEKEDQPVAVVGIGAGATMVSSGYSFTCAVVSGAAKCWGNNAFLVLGNGLGASYASAVPVAVTALTSGVTAISASSSDHACALTSAGAVKCWGTSGALGDGTTDDAGTPVDVVSFP